jgi:hypothetical protein
MRVFKSLNGYTDDGDYETNSVCFNNNKIKGQCRAYVGYFKLYFAA